MFFFIISITKANERKIRKPATILPVNEPKNLLHFLLLGLITGQYIVNYRKKNNLYNHITNCPPSPLIKNSVYINENTFLKMFTKAPATLQNVQLEVIWIFSGTISSSTDNSRRYCVLFSNRTTCTNIGSTT